MADQAELLRELFDAWNRGRFDLDEYAEMIDPEVVVDSNLTGSEWHGYEGVKGWLDDISQQFETWTLKIDEIREAKADVWLIRGSIHSRGRRSGIDLETPVGWVVWFRGGRIVRWGGFLSPAEAEQTALGPEPT